MYILPCFSHRHHSQCYREWVKFSSCWNASWLLCVCSNKTWNPGTTIHLTSSTPFANVLMTHFLFFLICYVYSVIAYMCMLVQYTISVLKKAHGNVHTVYLYTVIWEIFVVKKFLYLFKDTKIKRTKYFQCTYYVIECELNYRRVRKFFNTNILHTNIS